LALEDRRRIYDYIQQDSFLAAELVDDRIRDQVAILKDFPESGRLGRIEGTRELVISKAPYVAAYRITGNAVRVLRILHAAQLWPDELPDR
jgi:toxin ParE1/3/4